MEGGRLVVRTARRLAHEPGFALAALLLLGLGTGLTTAGFGLLDRLLWRPLPGLPDDDRVVALATSEDGQRASVSSYVDLRDLAVRGRAFAAVAAFKGMGAMELEAGDGESAAVPVTMVSADYFRTLGLRPALGRFFTREEAEPPGVPAVVISHALWQARFGGRRDVVGRTLALDGLRCAIVGVAPPGFAGTAEDLRAAAFLPLSMQPALMGEDLLAERGWGGVLGLARLRPGVSPAAAAADLSRVSHDLAREFPRTNAARTMSLEPLAASRVSTLARTTWLGIGATVGITVALVLLVACANVAALLATRAVARHAELGLRRSLGASPRRLALELGVEALVLAAAGGALGLVVATAALAAVRHVPLPALAEVRVDGRVLATSVLATLLSALLAALSPLLEARRQLAAAARSARAPRGRGRRVGVALQLAVSLVLLVGTTLFARTLARLQGVPLGFEARGLLTADVGARAGSDAAERMARWHAVAEAMRGVPGVRAAALTSRLPGGNDSDTLGVRLTGPQGRVETSLAVQAVGGDYFRALGVTPLAGRGIEVADERGGAPVTVVNERLARRFWPGRAAIGQTLEVIGSAPLTVVGVVPDIKDGALRAETTPLFYVPWSLAPQPPRSLYLLARVAGEPAALATAVRRAGTGAGAGRVRDVAPLADRLATATAPERLVVAILGGLAGLALLLTGVGLHSLLAWGVAQRGRELAVRVAVGAEPRRLRRLVLGQALALAATGIAAGSLGGLAVVCGARSLLFGVAPYDPLNLLLPAGVLLATAMLAAWWPAHRATRVDPMHVLRG